jgi:hypothetical protein
MASIVSNSTKVLLLVLLIAVLIYTLVFGQEALKYMGGPVTIFDIFGK